MNCGSALPMLGGVGFPDLGDTLGQHQGFRFGLQGRGAGSHEELYQPQDVFFTLGVMAWL
jgi:hypothetical protein